MVGERERQRGECFSSFSVSAVSLLLLLLLAESTIPQVYDEAEALRRGEVVASRSLENLEKSFFCSPLATPLLFRFKKTQNDNSAAKAKPAHKAGKGGKADEAGEALKDVKVSSSSA